MKERTKEKIGIQIQVIVAIMTFTIGILAIVYDTKNFLGFFKLEEGFLYSIYNFSLMILMVSLLTGLIFLISTGGIYSYKFQENYKSNSKTAEKIVKLGHRIMFVVQRFCYSNTLSIFVFSSISILWNLFGELIGVDTNARIIIALIIMIASLLAFLGITILEIWSSPKKSK